MREIFLNNDHAVSFSTVDRITGIAFSGLELTARLSLTPTGPAIATGSVTLQLELQEVPACSGMYEGVFKGANITFALSGSFFGSGSLLPHSPGVYEIVASGSHLEASTPFTVRAQRFI